MFAIFCRRRLSLGVPRKSCVFADQQFRACSSSVCENASEKSFTVSYLMNTCGLSSEDAISASNKLCFESPEKPDAVLHLLRMYGFTEALIPRIIIRWPNVLVASPTNTLLPKLEFFRTKGVPDPGKDKLAALVDRVVEMGFDSSKPGFVHAIQVFLELTESSLKQKREVYRKCGWSESDMDFAFLRCPFCMTISEKKIMANMNFLVNTMGCKPSGIAQYPLLLAYSLKKTMKPRCLVARVLNEKRLKNMDSVATILKRTEKEFLERYILKYEKILPELLDIYLGKTKPPLKLDFSRDK